MSARRDEEFTEFVTARLPALRRVAYLLCQDWHSADDLVQAAITRLYMHWGRAQAMEHTEAYVRAILFRQSAGPVAAAGFSVSRSTSPSAGPAGSCGRSTSRTSTGRACAQRTCADLR